MSKCNIKNRTIFCRDNLEIMRGINSESVDLIYLDPPFNKKRVFEAPIGSSAAGAEFRDIWQADDVKKEDLEVLKGDFPHFCKVLEGISAFAHKGMEYYLLFMFSRLREMHRILKPTGSLYYHCDTTASHYIKVMLDRLFGKDNFRNEIVWGYGLGGSSKKQFSKKHDTIFWYSKSSAYHFTKPMVKARSHKMKGQDKGMTDLWNDIPSINNMSKERTGYPTQKPLKLLARIIQASSHEGDIVFDPFCGCATTCVAAENLTRQWIGIDISEQAFKIVKKRLNDQQENEKSLFKEKIIARDDLPERTDLGQAMSKTEARRILYGEQKGYCAGCGVHFHYENLTVDHKVPTSKGGADTINNFQLLCGNCNSIKGNRSMVYLNSRLKKQA